MRPVAVLAAHAEGAIRRLREDGQPAVAFATSADLEAFVRAGGACGVIDLLLTDLADGTAAPDRLTAASLLGLPQVVGPGGLPADLSPEAADRLGLAVAQRVSATGGPAAVLLPLQALTPGLGVFGQSVESWAYGFEVQPLNAAADDPVFAVAAAGVLLGLLPSPRR